MQHKINNFIVNNSVAFKHVHSVVQPPPLSGSKTFPSPQRETPYPVSNHSPFPPPASRWQPQVCFLSSWIYLFFIFHIKYTQYVTFRVWLLSLSLMFSRFALQRVSVLHSFLWLNDMPLCGETTICLCVPQLTAIYLSFFHILAIVNSAAVNIYVHGFVWTPFFQFFWVYI